MSELMNAGTPDSGLEKSAWSWWLDGIHDFILLPWLNKIVMEADDPKQQSTRRFAVMVYQIAFALFLLIAVLMFGKGGTPLVTEVIDLSTLR